MEYIIAFVISLLVGLGIGALVKIRLKHTSVSGIHKHISAVLTILLFSFALFALIGPNIWSAILIPTISLVLVFFLVRKAVWKLLEFH